MKTYSELITLDSYKDRLDYLKLGDNNVLSPRRMSGSFYMSTVWRNLRKQIISRDGGFDLGVFGVYISGPMYIHHIEPIIEHDIRYQTKKLLDPDNLITVSLKTHNMIHYNYKEKDVWTPREPGDTKHW